MVAVITTKGGELEKRGEGVLASTYDLHRPVVATVGKGVRV